MGLIISSCNSGSKRFNPTQRKSPLTSKERQTVIQKIKSELSINYDTLLFSHGVKMSVLPPMPDGKDITEDVAMRFATKMLGITTANGIGGINNVPDFALSARVHQTVRAVTGTSPQKMLVKYAVTYEVVNVKTGDVFATATQNIIGAGNSFVEASDNAIQTIQNTSLLQKMLSDGSTRIIQWYSENLQSFKNQVESAIASKNYDYALALVESVPAQASQALQYASKRQPEIFNQMKKEHAEEMLAELQSAIASADGEFSPKVIACMQMIPSGTTEYKQAQSKYAAYEKKVEAKRKTLELKAEKDDAYQKRMAEDAAKRTHEKELADIETEKIKAKYESKANAIAMEKSMRYDSDQRHKGFWGKLGDRILGGIDSFSDSKYESDFEND
jgi:hypothetical protein